MMAGSQEALDRFERQTAIPMISLALAIIPLLVLPLVFQLSPSVETRSSRSTCSFGQPLWWITEIASSSWFYGYGPCLCHR